MPPPAVAIQSGGNFTLPCPARRHSEDMNSTPEWPLTLYFDGHCPLCLKEVGWLASRADPARLRLVDLHQLAGSEPGLPDQATLMATLHARDASGRWFTGVDATLAAWQAAGVGAWLAWLRLPGVHWLARHIYRVFARHRMSLGRWLGPTVCDQRCRQQAMDQLGAERINDGR